MRIWPINAGHTGGRSFLFRLRCVWVVSSRTHFGLLWKCLGFLIEEYYLFVICAVRRLREAATSSGCNVNKTSVGRSTFLRYCMWNSIYWGALKFILFILSFPHMSSYQLLWTPWVESACSSVEPGFLIHHSQFTRLGEVVSRLSFHLFFLFVLFISLQTFCAFFLHLRIKSRLTVNLLVKSYIIKSWRASHGHRHVKDQASTRTTNASVDWCGEIRHLPSGTHARGLPQHCTGQKAMDGLHWQMYIGVKKKTCTCHVLEPVYDFFVCYSSCCNLFHDETVDRCVEPIIWEICDLYYYFKLGCWPINKCRKENTLWIRVKSNSPSL